MKNLNSLSKKDQEKYLANQAQYDRFDKISNLLEEIDLKQRIPDMPYLLAFVKEGEIPKDDAPVYLEELRDSIWAAMNKLSIINQNLLK